MVTSWGVLGTQGLLEEKELEALLQYCTVTDETV